MKHLTIVQPFLFAVFPILSLYASNLGLVRPGEILLPIALVIALTSLLLWLGMRLLKDLEAAAIILSAFWLLFFSFGKLLALLGGPGHNREPFLLAGCGLFLVALTAAAVKYRGKLSSASSIVSIVGLALIAMPLVTIAPALLPSSAARQGLSREIAQSVLEQGRGGNLPAETAKPASSVEASKPVVTRSVTPAPSPPPAAATAPLRKPSIYYIILDGYARSDVLADIYGVDNSEFIQGLTERGFFVARESRANYCQTYLSLASSLNMTYLDAVAQRTGEDSDDRRPLQDLLRNNAVAALLREQGYTYAAFATGYAEGELSAADIYRSAPWSTTQFQTGLISTTPVSPVISLQYENHRQRVRYAFEHLPEMAEESQPVFVVAHIASPHPPFVFGPEGEAITPNREFTFSDGSHYTSEASRDEYIRGYSGQVRYISEQAEALIDAILARSLEPPVIIVQADHGPGSRLNWYSAEQSDLRERMAILNAYYLPDGGAQWLYDEITPVNTFRLVFNHYLGTHFPILEDQSYYSTWMEPYRFIAVP